MATRPYEGEPDRATASIETEWGMASMTAPVRDTENITAFELEHWFRYHAPMVGQPEKYETLREAGHHLAKLIVTLVPPGSDQRAAVRKVREAIMTANAGIACGGV